MYNSLDYPNHEARQKERSERSKAKNEFVPGKVNIRQGNCFDMKTRYDRSRWMEFKGHGRHAQEVGRRIVRVDHDEDCSSELIYPA